MLRIVSGVAGMGRGRRGTIRDRGRGGLGAGVYEAQGTQFGKVFEGSAGQARSSEAKAVIAATLELHRASERAKRPEFTDEIREQLADSNPPLPSALVVFAENDCS